MSTHSMDRDVEDATLRLVRGIVGYADTRSVNLANRIVHSSLEQHDDFAKTRRKLERSDDKNLQKDVTRLYEQLQQASGDDESSKLPQDILAVLVGLMGNDSRVPTQASIEETRPTVSTTKISARSEKALQDSFIESLAAEEAFVLRECLYALQGIDGERIRFYWNKENDDIAYEGIYIQSAALHEVPIPPNLMAHSKLGSGAMDALRICGEAGWLYVRVQSYIQQIQQPLRVDSVSRAFASALSHEVQSYRDFLAHMEEKRPLCLRAILTETRLPIGRLKTLAMLTDGLQHLSGGQLLSALHSHARHGDTRHAALVHSLLSLACRPWFDMVYDWTTQGILSDPAEELFVTESLHVNDRHLWHDRYAIDHSKVPTGIIENDLIEPSFVVGKGINYIRKCLLDDEWTLELDTAGSTDTNTTNQASLGYYYSSPVAQTTQGPSFRSTLKKAASLVHSHILQSLRDEHSMIQHLYALKQFLLLGQGDFFSALLEGLHSEFDEGRNSKGIVGIYRHTLAAIVESALRSTNAIEFPSFILQRLQVELRLDANDDVRYMFGPNKDSESDDRTVWDIFMLEYILPDPLMAIVHPTALKNYKSMFLFLFELRKIDFQLNSTWRQSAVLQHALQTSAQYNAINVASSPGYAQATVLLRQISMTRQSMMHFVVNLKSYLMFEVLEGGWKQLVREIEEAQTLDEVIASHDRYLNGILRKSLLRPEASDESTDLGNQLKELLRLSGEFCRYQQTLFGEALQAADRAALKRREAEQRLKEGDWGFHSEQEISEEETFFGLADTSKLEKADNLSEEFNKLIVKLLKALDNKLHGGQISTMDVTSPATPSPEESVANDEDQDDLDSLRFLTFQLDHNNYYASRANS